MDHAAVLTTLGSKKKFIHSGYIEPRLSFTPDTHTLSWMKKRYGETNVKKGLV